MKIIVTGGAGFIGSNLVRSLVKDHGHQVLNLDALTYAGNACSLDDLAGHPGHRMEIADICDAAAVTRAFAGFKPDAVMHLAAESHVDRSIDAPGRFVETNVLGTYNLLQAARAHCDALSPQARASFRFLHVSTDEVYGSLGAEGSFVETTPYDPRSPYAASKAASDHLARAWHHTFGLPVLITNCSNNYGPFQFPEKLVPVVILSALRGQEIPVYGDGANVRDWLHVGDHVDALHLVLLKGRPGETYNIGGNHEMRNIDLVRLICAELDDLSPRGDGRSHADRIRFVADRPGHDRRYAIDSTKIRNELGWCPTRGLRSGFRETVRWYLDNAEWTERILSGKYQLQRLGRPSSP